MKEVTLSKIIGRSGVFIDGDWIESKDQDPNGEVRLIQLADIGDGEFLNKSARFLTVQKAKQLNCTFLKPGDLLIARMPDPLGRACIFPGDDKPCITVVDVCIVRPDPTIASAMWLKFQINNHKFRNKINKFVTGTTRQRISRSNLDKLEFKIPQLTDQIRIAVILSKTESLIIQRNESLLLLDKLVKDTFLKLFADLLKNEDKYVLITDVADFIDYRGKTPLRVEKGIPLISAKCVRRGYFDEQRLDYIEPETYEEIMTRGFPEAGDVLFTTEGATMGFTCRIPPHFKKFAVGQRLITLKCKEGNSPTTLEFILNHPFIQGKILKKATGSAAIGIRSAEFSKIRIPKPPFELQIRFAQIVEKAEALKAHYQASLKELENLYGSLLQRAFKGEL